MTFSNRPNIKKQSRKNSPKKKVRFNNKKKENCKPSSKNNGK
jgi:hypothetical protein